MNNTANSKVNLWISRSNYIISTVSEPIMYTEALCLFILSIAWSMYLFMKIMKDKKNHKMTMKTQNSKPEYFLKNAVKNLYTNKTKNILLILICISECALVLSFILYQIGKLKLVQNTHPSHKLKLKILHEFLVDARYLNSLRNWVIRVSIVINTISMYSLFLFVRILTQFLIHQYSYYKSSLKLKRKLIFAISLLVTLSILGLIRPLILLQYALTVLVIIYEFIFIAILTKRLLRLLKQRLNDARQHENQSYRVVLYYRIAYADYKYSSTALLLALFFQVIAFSINFLHPIVMMLVVHPNMELSLLFTTPHHSSHGMPIFAQEYNLFISTLEEIFMTIGLSLLLTPYLIVSIRRIFWYFKKRRSASREFSVLNSRIHELLKNNYGAYALYHR